MRSWSIPAGRIFGVEIRIHLTFFFLLIFVLFTDAVRGTSQVLVGRGVALVAIIFGSVVLHEIAHTVVALKAGVPLRAIILLPLGGVALMDETVQAASEPQRDIRVAIVGPIVSFLVAMIAAAAVAVMLPAAGLSVRPFVTSANLARSLVWTNFFLAFFNILPAYPLDGGRVYRALLLARMEPAQATRRAVTLGQFFAMTFMFAGIWNTWLLLAGFFLFAAAQLEERSAVFQSVLESLRMEDVMLTDFATLSPADTLEDALTKAVHTLQDDFPVIRGSDMVGVISRQKILDALRAQGNGYVQAVMNRVFDVAHKTESLASAFRKISARGMTLIPVVEDERLVGIVTLQNLMHSMSLLAESRKLQRQTGDSGE